MAGSTIYNTTDGPLVVDDEGRVLGGREHRDGVDVQAEPVASHIAAGRLVVVDTPTPAKRRRNDPAPSTEEA